MTPAEVLQAPNLGEMLRRSCLAFADRPAQMRPEKGGYRTLTYKEVYEDVWAFAKGVSALGLNRGDKIIILGESGWEWGAADWACQTLGLVVVPIYPTLPPDQTQYIAKDSDAKMAIVLSPKLAPKLAGMELPIAYLRAEGGREGILDLARTSPLDRTRWEADMSLEHEEDLATIIYTSGTTGQPKGAMLPHRCFLSLSRGIVASLPITKDDLFLSFLPLAHVFERYAGHALPVSVGACVAYAGSLASLGTDLAKVKPTIMTTVPRFLEATRARILDGVKKQKPLNQKMFRLALSQGIARFRGQFAPLAGVLDRLVAEKIRERTGGRIRFFVSGGAALNPSVSDFYIGLGIKVLQGYGLTETCAASCVNDPANVKPWTVGPPIQGVELKIAPDGEILLRGPSIMSGYYKLPEETARSIDSEGWFHTGDIGRIEERSLIITDRKKDLLVLANGKNVAPQAVENKLKESDLIGEAVVFGDGSPYCYALLAPEFPLLEARLKERGVSFADDAAASRTPEARSIMKAEIDKANARLADFEKVKKFAILPKMLTVEDGELTPSMKVKRRVVKERFADLLKPLQSED